MKFEKGDYAKITSGLYSMIPGMYNKVGVVLKTFDKHDYVTILVKFGEHERYRIYYKHLKKLTKDEAMVGML